MALRVLDVVREVDLRPRHAIDALETDVHPREQLGIEFLVLDARRISANRKRVDRLEKAF